jgi:hypothetical protein
VAARSIRSIEAIGSFSIVAVSASRSWGAERIFIAINVGNINPPINPYPKSFPLEGKELFKPSPYPFPIAIGTLPTRREGNNDKPPPACRGRKTERSEVGGGMNSERISFNSPCDYNLVVLEQLHNGRSPSLKFKRGENRGRVQICNNIFHIYTDWYIFV